MNGFHVSVERQQRVSLREFFGRDRDTFSISLSLQRFHYQSNKKSTNDEKKKGENNFFRSRNSIFLFRCFTRCLGAGQQFLLVLLFLFSNIILTVIREEKYWEEETTDTISLRKKKTTMGLNSHLATETIKKEREAIDQVKNERRVNERRRPNSC